jgi:hypothetical protein
MHTNYHHMSHHISEDKKQIVKNLYESGIGGVYCYGG